MAPDGAHLPDHVIVVAEHPVHAQALSRALRHQDDGVTVSDVCDAAFDDHLPAEGSTTVVVACPVDDHLAARLEQLRTTRQLRVLVLEGGPSWGPVPDGFDCETVSVDVGIRHLGEVIARLRPPTPQASRQRGSVTRPPRSPHAAAPRHPPPLVDLLTPREVDVLRALMAGLVRDDIGALLGISPHTVRTHLQNVFGKLRCHTQLEAMTIGLRAGLEPMEVGDAQSSENVA